MTAIVGEGVSLRGLMDDGFSYTWNVTGGAVAANVGKAVSQDLTAPNSVKLALLDEPLIGSLVSLENRVQEGIVVGSVARKGVFVWNYAGPTPTLGQSVVGSAIPGSVKAAAAAPGCIVIDVDTVNVQVTVLFD